ncbi:MAG: aminotransferase [Pseudomonadota bacterium]
MTEFANDLAALDQKHALHPWTHFESFAETAPLVIERGEGCYLWDTDGRKYLDAVGGLWCTNIGLGRAEMGQAMADQATKLGFSNTFVDMTHGPAALLAAKLAELAPGDLSRVKFTTGGSTAIDTAYRMAVYYHRCRGDMERTHVIARDDSYHGSTFVSISISKRSGDKVPEFHYKEDEIHHISSPNLYRRPADMDEDAFCAHLVAEFEAKIEEVGAESIAAFFAEPIQASGGVVMPPSGYLRAMWEVCQRYGILFVADEVVTAFGRLGHWFASKAVFDVQPDIICCAKGLSSGYQPIGAVIFSDQIWQAMQGDRWYTSGFTYSGHPVACAVALKNIEIIERENLLENAREMGAYFHDCLAPLSNLPLVGDVRGYRLIACVESVANKETKELLPDALDVGKRISNAAEAMGLMVRPIGHLNVMSPALIIDRPQIEFVAETLEKAITQVADDLTREGVRLD